MNKLVLALATVATLGLSTAAFAEDPSASTRERVQPATQSQSHVTHNVKASHRVGVKKVVRHDRGLHRGFSHSRHYGYHKGKKVVIKHAPANRAVKMRTTS